MSKVHVIGAGLAGLAAALSLTAAGRIVVLHEAGPVAGGRCRSYFDKELGLRIDNGNHLLLSGNISAQGYIAEIGAADRFDTPSRAVFPFVDLKTGERWTVRMNSGRIPWWIFSAKRRIPGTRLSDYWAMAKIARITDNTPVCDCMRRGRLYWRLVEPLAVAALNTGSRQGLARLLGAVMRDTLLRGGAACRPMLPKEGLSEALIDPAIATLRQRGADIRFSSRIAEVSIKDRRVVSLRGPAGVIALDPGDAVVLAVPAAVAPDLVPGLSAPDGFESILNIHFNYQAEEKSPLSETGFIGIMSGTAEWLFRKPDHISVTISAANGIVDEAARAIAKLVWPNVVETLGLDPLVAEDLPPFRVVKERRATFAATAEQEQRRPGAMTELAQNLMIAGDWTATGLPATIEGAIRSGRLAAGMLLSNFV